MTFLKCKHKVTLPKVNPKSSIAKRVVIEFCQHVARMKFVLNMYRQLFEDSKAQKLMDVLAKDFFLRFNYIIVDYLLLEFAKLADPAFSKISGRENFTLSNLIETIDWSAKNLVEIKEIVNEAIAFTKKVLPARHKLLAHNDKKSILSKARLGGFPKGEDKKYLENLEKLCNIMHEECFGTIFGEIGVTCRGDVLDFKKALSYAVAFKSLLAESKGDELIRLMDMIKEKR